MSRRISDNLRFKRIVRHIKGGEVLDVGSNEGYLHRMMRRSHGDKKFYTLDVRGDPDYKIDLNKPKELNREFDTLIAGEILEHVQNPSKTIEFFGKHIKKGGRLIITTPNAIGLQYLRNPSWCVARDKYDEHIHAFTLPMLELLFRKNEFRVLHTEYINAFWMNRNPLQLVPAFIKRLRPDLLIVGEKL